MVMHVLGYFGALTRCKSWVFETYIKRVARQSGFLRHLAAAALPYKTVLIIPAGCAMMRRPRNLKTRMRKTP
jgi:hypothetical protein